MPERIYERVDRAIAERVFPGCAIGVITGGERLVLPFGTRAYDGVAVREDTVYDLASVTKSLPLASLSLLLAHEGRIRLDERASAYIPELRDEYGATLEDLLRYRVRGPRMSTLAQMTHEEVSERIFSTGFDGPPGDRAYANAPAFVLGVALERATGHMLHELAEKYLFGPLGMRDTAFFPRDASRCAPTEMVADSEVLGIVHDESARIFAGAGHSVGHAGLFSTVPDLLAFSEALLSGSYAPATAGAQKGLGWQAREPYWMGNNISDTAFGKTGFTGTSVIVDMERQISLIILSNRTYPTRPADTEAINTLRRDIADIVFSRE